MKRQRGLRKVPSPAHTQVGASLPRLNFITKSLFADKILCICANCAWVLLQPPSLRAGSLLQIRGKFWLQARKSDNKRKQDWPKIVRALLIIRYKLLKVTNSSFWGDQIYLKAWNALSWLQRSVLERRGWNNCPCGSKKDPETGTIRNKERK